MASVFNSANSFSAGARDAARSFSNIASTAATPGAIFSARLTSANERKPSNSAFSRRNFKIFKMLSLLSHSPVDAREMNAR